MCNHITLLTLNCVMPRFVLVPESFDCNELKGIDLPENLYNPHTKENPIPTVASSSVNEILDDQKTTPEMNAATELIHTTQKNLPDLNSPSKGKLLPYTVLKYTTNPQLARKVLKFLKNTDFRADQNDNLLLNGRVYPISLHSNFIDLVNDNRKSNDNTAFYDLLKENGFDKTLLSRSKQKYFK